MLGEHSRCVVVFAGFKPASRCVVQPRATPCDDEKSQMMSSLSLSTLVDTQDFAVHGFSYDLGCDSVAESGTASSCAVIPPVAWLGHHPRSRPHGAGLRC